MKAIFGVHSGIKKAKELMPMLGLNETVDDFAMANIVH